MVLLLKKIIKGYMYINDNLSDPRTKDLPLVSSPFYVFLILCAYLFFVLEWGPKYMAKRKPYKLDLVIILFNIVQIVACGLIVYEFLTYCFFQYDWRCEPIDYSYDFIPMKAAFYSWVYFTIKIMDLLDTVFFVLRKKNNQISFLHVYHHTGMVIMTWMGCKFIGGGHGLFIGFANCIVHVFMYFYYLISIWDEKYKKSVWWKKYITQLQMGQFLFLALMFGQILFRPDCTYPRWVVVAFLPQNIFMFVLFSDFYYRAYIKKKPAKKSENTQHHNIKKIENTEMTNLVK